MNTYTVSRRLEIDAGHRVMTHGSKCRHLHGHRYVVEAVCRALGGGLHRSGEQTDMLVDFGFLAAELARHVEAPCDHGFIASSSDAELLAMFAPGGGDGEAWRARVEREVERVGYFSTTETRLATKLYIIAAQPTAERLAAHWFKRLAEPVEARSLGLARLVRVRVWETPNSLAEFGDQENSLAEYGGEGEREEGR